MRKKGKVTDNKRKVGKIFFLKVINSERRRETGRGGIEREGKNEERKNTNLRSGKG